MYIVHPMMTEKVRYLGKERGKRGNPSAGPDLHNNAGGCAAFQPAVFRWMLSPEG